MYLDELYFLPYNFDYFKIMGYLKCSRYVVKIFVNKFHL